MHRRILPFRYRGNLLLLVVVGLRVEVGRSEMERVGGSLTDMIQATKLSRWKECPLAASSTTMFTTNNFPVAFQNGEGGCEGVSAIEKRKSNYNYLLRSKVL